LYHQTHPEIQNFHQIHLNIINMSAPVGPIIAQLQQLPARSRQGLNNLRQRLFQQGTSFIKSIPFIIIFPSKVSSI
jgi:hypothetical protein